MDKKRCPSCEEWLERTAENFHRDKSRPDGLHCYCKRCAVAKEMARRANSPEVREKIRANNRRRYHEKGKEKAGAYYQEHRETLIARQKAYYQEHRERLRAYQRAYYREHREDILARQASPEGREKKRQHNREYYRKKREQILERQRAYDRALAERLKSMGTIEK